MLFKPWIRTLSILASSVLLQGCLVMNSLFSSPPGVDPTPSTTPTPTATPVPILHLQSDSATLAPQMSYSVLTTTWDSGLSADEITRENHATALIHVGSGTNRRSVLVATGGQYLSNGNMCTTTVVYDPLMNAWTSTAALNTPRYVPAATVIKIGADQHEGVLVTGGFDQHGSPLASTEIYDPVGGAGRTPTWNVVGSLTTARGYARIATLSNGKVVVVGGSTDLYNHPGTSLSSVEVYDPVAQTWSVGSSMATPRVGFAMKKIQVGADHHDALLAIGGTAPEIYDSVSQTWGSAGTFPYDADNSSLTILQDGSALVVGGQDTSYNKYNNTTLYVPSSTSTPATAWTAKSIFLTDGVYAQTENLLPSGKVLITSGYGSGGLHKWGEVYDPASDSWTNELPMSASRSQHTSNVLDDGRVIIYGGTTWDTITTANVVEVFQNYAPTAPVPTDGVAPYTYQKISGNGTLYSNGNYIPNQAQAEVALIQVTDSLGATAIYTVTTQ